MNYSKIHQLLRKEYLSDKINDSPDLYLGPNYETVLNYWWYLESLSEISKIDYSDNSATKPFGYNNFIIEQANLLTNYHQAEAWYVTQLTLNIGEWYGWVTIELICMHRILDEGKSLFYLPKIFAQ
jgi:hypothetical protein